MLGKLFTIAPGASVLVLVSSNSIIQPWTIGASRGYLSGMQKCGKDIRC